MPGWSWSEIAPLVEGCDAVYLNFITGDELDLACAQALRLSFSGPIYCDLHSLLLMTGPGGSRQRRSLDRWSEWLRCFDVVQLNEDELAALSAHWGDPMAFAASVVGGETRLLFVTLGPAGSLYVIAPDALPLGAARRHEASGQSPVRTGRIMVEAAQVGDPTGCGDVWGMIAFCALLAGEDVTEAMGRANTIASRNVRHRGATGLNRFLRGEIARG